MTRRALPLEVQGAGGPITIEVVGKCADEEGAHCWGLWKQAERRVVVERHKSDRHMWATLYHELVHAALDDAGLSHFLTTEQQEALADAIATARVREKFG